MCSTRNICGLAGANASQGAWSPTGRSARAEHNSSVRACDGDDALQRVRRERAGAGGESGQRARQGWWGSLSVACIHGSFQAVWRRREGDGRRACRGEHALQHARHVVPNTKSAVPRTGPAHREVGKGQNTKYHPLPNRACKFPVLQSPPTGGDEGNFSFLLSLYSSLVTEHVVHLLPPRKRGTSAHAAALQRRNHAARP